MSTTVPVTGIVPEFGGATVTVVIAGLLPAVFVAVNVNVVVAATSTVFIPIVTGVTIPTPGSMSRESAPVTFQERTTGPPPVVSVVGFAVKLMMFGFCFTVTEQVAVVVPFKLVAVRVNVVKVATWTVVLPLLTGDTAPTVGSMVRLTAPLTAQDSSTGPGPSGRSLGLQVKILMNGLLGPSLVQPANRAAPKNAIAMVRVGTVRITREYPKGPMAPTLVYLPPSNPPGERRRLGFTAEGPNHGDFSSFRAKLSRGSPRPRTSGIRS
jgi:hypothetical protein